MPEDHYATLGVARDAAPEVIRKAYLSLARRLHPDVSDEPDAAERFKVITSAYNVLSDPEQRREYELDLIDEEQFGTGGASHEPRRGDDMLMHLEISLRESVLGAKRAARVRGIVPCCACDGRGVLASGAACAGCEGTGRITGDQDIEVEIPRGSSAGDRLRLEGRGEAGWNGGPSGDLFIELRVAADEVFSRDGDSLRAELRLSVSDAVLGADLTIDTWDGPLEVCVAAGTQPGTVLDFPGYGVPITVEGQPSHERGTLLLTVEVDVSIDLNAPQRQALEWFRDMRPEDVSGLWSARTGVLQQGRQKSIGRERV
ncbi:MAG: DnaJ C-terminal domain-containing protein [Pseudoclavibacter sp.]